jgi:GNAT superfamily N-acetyltransferase
MGNSSNSGVVIQVRTFRAGDTTAEGLLSPPPDQDGHRWRRTLVAVAEGQVLGAATLTLNAVTDSYFCEVAVSPDHRRSGLGTRLFHEVQQTSDRRLPVLGRAMSSQPLRRHFAEHLGGSVLMHCPTPSIDPASTAGRAWAAAQRLPEGYVTSPVADAPTDEVRAAWSRYFTWSHQPFGAVRAEALPARWEDYREGVDGNLSALCRDPEGRIVALSLVSPEIWDGRTFVVAETVHRDQPGGLDLLQATLAASLSTLADRGVRRVEIEGHSGDSHIPELFATLPPGPSDPLDIYVFPATSAAA